MNLSQILERIGRLAELSNEELTELRGENGNDGAIQAAYGELSTRADEETQSDAAPSSETLEGMRQLVDARSKVDAEWGERVSAGEQIVAERAELDAAMAGDDTTDAEETPTADETAAEDTPPEGETEETPTGDEQATADATQAVDAAPSEAEVVSEAEQITEEAAEAQPEPVVASTPPARRAAVVRVPEDRRPAPVSTAPAGPAIKAATNLGSRPVGGEFSGWGEAAEATLEVLNSFGRGPHIGPEVHFKVGSVSTKGQRPEALQIKEQDSVDSITSKMAALRDGAQRFARGETPEAITAAGLCAPVEVRYDQVTISESSRPLRDSHPSMDARRGGLQYNAPSVLSDVLVNQAAAAIDVITEDAQAAGPVSKTVQNVGCGSLTTVEVEAISERLEFDNWGDRYNPERMEQWLQLARAAHAREAERQGLDAIEAGSTATTVATSGIGSTRELIASIQTAVWGIGNRHRAPDDQRYRVVLPDFILRMCAIDLTWQLPGDNTLAITRAEIERLLARDGVNVTFTKEGATGSGMDSAAQSAGVLIDFPEFVDWYIYPEGSWLFLDGGELDFGVVRDSTLNTTNEFQTFFESFEAWALIGVESLHVNQAICNNGAAAAAVAADCGLGS